MYHSSRGTTLATKRVAAAAITTLPLVVKSAKITATTTMASTIAAGSALATLKTLIRKEAIGATSITRAARTIIKRERVMRLQTHRLAQQTTAAANGVRMRATASSLHLTQDQVAQ